MLKITDLSLRRGSRLLLENVELDVFPGQRMGLTGANGSGKSSLFAVIAGRLEADQGNVTLPRDTLITEVLQETPDSARTAIDYVIDGDQSYRSLELKIAQAELDDNGALLATLHSQMDDIDGFRVSARAGQLLHGLGFTAKEQSQRVNTFSGGWRMRLNLACALMARADLLLLDEPTNHLDLDAMVWLERWLTSYVGIVLVISHDREFLDRSVTRIAHIENRTIQVYEGNYSMAEERRAAWIEIQNKQHLRQQKQVSPHAILYRSISLQGLKSKTGSKPFESTGTPEAYFTSSSGECVCLRVRNTGPLSTSTGRPQGNHCGL